MTTAEMSSEEKVINNLKYWHNTDLKILFDGILNSKLDMPYSMGESHQLSKLKNLIRSTQEQETKETHFGTFDASGYEAELEECTGIEVESLENLKGARIQILCDATGDDEYFDVVFLNYYDEEEQPLVINALSKEHITFE